MQPAQVRTQKSNTLYHIKATYALSPYSGTSRVSFSAAHPRLFYDHSEGHVCGMLSNSTSHSLRRHWEWLLCAYWHHVETPCNRSVSVFLVPFIQQRLILLSLSPSVKSVFLNRVKICILATLKEVQSENVCIQAEFHTAWNTSLNIWFKPMMFFNWSHCEVALLCGPVNWSICMSAVNYVA